jgi:hypothetical protein
MANEKISDLATAGTVVGTDSTVIVSSGVNKQTLFSTILAYIQTVTGWNLTGTTTLTGASTIDIDGNTLEFSGGEVGIGGAAESNKSLVVTGVFQSISGDVLLSVTSIDWNIGDNSAGLSNIAGSLSDKTINMAADAVQIYIDGTANTVEFTASNGIKANNAIPAYANNAAALSAIGAGKLYYTDVAGEYMVKLSH